MNIMTEEIGFWEELHHTCNNTHNGLVLIEFTPAKNEEKTNRELNSFTVIIAIEVLIVNSLNRKYMQQVARIQVDRLFYTWCWLLLS